MKRFLKILGYIVLVITLIFGGILGYAIYDDYQSAQKREAEKQDLLRWKGSEGWQWHQEFDRIQSKKVDGRTVLRRIYPDENQQVWGYINQDGSLGSLSIWHVACEPGTKIVTDATYSDGETVFLRCHSDGERLSHQVVWTSGETDPYWSFDYGGFSISEDFGEWDFTELKRESAVSRAIKPQMAEEFLESD